ncbi:MAG: hypothetical protein IPJ28_04825 [Betaproteobacteria bacterium]|nr:hypothetical protein [Betaproteobacteria bacterium]
MHFAVAFMSGMVHHRVLFLLLDRAYRGGGDLSIVYPAHPRDKGPLLTVAFPIAVFGEPAGPLGARRGATHRRLGAGRWPVAPSRSPTATCARRSASRFSPD